MKILVIAALAVIAIAGFGAAGTALAARAQSDTQPVHLFRTANQVGEATLVRTNSGVSMRISSSVQGNLFDLGDPDPKEDGDGPVQFSPGDATTNWWVVFNNPDACTGQCGEGDVVAALFDGEENVAEIDVIFATGHVAGSQWKAAARLNEGDHTGSLFSQFDMNSIGLVDAMTAEVHLVVRSHGPASDLAPVGELAAAISSVEGGCQAFGGTNVCGDVQDVIFLSPTP